MNWLEYVRQNYTTLNLRFMYKKPKHPKYEWRGYYIRKLTIWDRYGEARLYVPYNMLEHAGYIDLLSKTMHPKDNEGAKAKVLEVYEYLIEQAG